MAVSSAFVGCPKLETLLNHHNLSSSSSSSSTSQTPLGLSGVRALPKNNRNRRILIQRARCELSSSDSPSNISALEQLKNSAPDRYTKERSSIVVIGLSIHTAPVEMREKLAIPEAEWPRAIGELCGLNHIEEAAVLSTCNRMEIYVLALSQHRGVKEVTEWMSKTSGIPVSEICQHRFLLYNKDATQHIFEVSAGLDSLVLGEGQILAQVKQVVKVGQGVNGFGRNISGLFKHAITVGKRVRTETNIAAGAVSVSSAAVELALMKLPDSSHASARMLIIGAGKMGKLVIKHLVAKGCTKMVVVNRSEERVIAIREEIPGVEIVYRPLDEMLASAAEADVVFTSTASETPLFLKEHVENLPPACPEIGGVRLFVDISVPRNVGSCVNEVETARVYNVDDLKEVVAANKEDRLRKAMEAQTIIAEESNQFEAWRDSLETVPTIKKLRAYAERIRVAELEKCLSKMGDDINKKTTRAVDDLSRGIVNRFLHGPMQHLRCDGSDSRTLSETLENMHALNRMYGLEKDILLTFRGRFELSSSIWLKKILASQFIKMPEARDRIHRPVDYAAIFANRRSNGVLLDEPASRLGLIEPPAQRSPSDSEPGSIGRGSLVVRGNFSSWRPGHGNRSGQIPFRSPQGRENVAMVTARRGRGRVSPSALPSWYPRTPLRDITHIMRAIERRRRAGMGVEGDGREIVIPAQGQVGEDNCLMVTPGPALGFKRGCPPSTARVHKMLLDISKEVSEEDEAGFITPEKKLLNSIDIVEKIVMEEMQKLKSTPQAKREEREKRVRTLMSMR